ncbi:1-acyl-sn-glycerol-3-phosphate acyltransferase beta [Stegostoma tigrinum]|uniref:1-acyl-sn-glycerol-3-phosphate acyltransferase beta n=1 Tax=Stegostoma tigrinum TaxID=3053191 RepID=UPI002870088C|nr:1-acyl-sn-glycerol-3-phosphate acyltransferase beta [Stegostoma tigrinum]
MLIQDPIVKGTNGCYSGCQCDPRIPEVYCLPGARVWDVTEWLQGILKREDDKAEAMAHVGTNDMGQVTEEWRTANVVPIFKKCCRAKPENYRSVNLTSAVGKMLRKILKEEEAKPDLRFGNMAGHANEVLVRSVLQHIKNLYGIKLEVKGLENLNVKGPYVIISNHQSSLDLMGMMEILPDRCVAIAKKELMYAGTVGLVCWLAGIIFINRQKKTDAKSVMTEAAQTMLKENIRLWVFPEGTRNHDGNMLPFKRGAFHLAIQAQVPIIPVVFSSYNDFYNRAEKRFTSGKCIVKVLPLMETRGMTTDDVPDLTERARNLLMTTWNEISAPILKMHGAQ